MKRMINRKILLIIFLFFFYNYAAAKNITKIYESNYVPASKLLLAVEPIMPGKVKTSVYDDKIILNGPENSVESVMSTLMALDVPQEMWQVNVYVGYKPDGFSGTTSYSTNDNNNSNRYVSVRTLNGAQAEVSISKAVREISSVSGYNTNYNSIKNQDDLNTENRAVLAGEIQETDNEIASQQKVIEDYENNNPGATVDNDATLSDYTDNLEILNNNRAVEQAKLSSYQDSLDNQQSQSNYASYGGSVNYNYINLPDALYVTPIKNGDLIKVKVVSVSSSTGVDSNYSSRSINTEVMAEPGEWTQIYGKSVDNDGTTYSTDTNTTSSNVWLKVEKAK